MIAKAGKAVEDFFKDGTSGVSMIVIPNPTAPASKGPV